MTKLKFQLHFKACNIKHFYHIIKYQNLIYKSSKYQAYKVRNKIMAKHKHGSAYATSPSLCMIIIIIIIINQVQDILKLQYNYPQATAPLIILRDEHGLNILWSQSETYKNRTPELAIIIALHKCRASKIIQLCSTWARREFDRLFAAAWQPEDQSSRIPISEVYMHVLTLSGNVSWLALKPGFRAEKLLYSSFER